jgi:hypothetical protein
MTKLDPGPVVTLLAPWTVSQYQSGHGMYIRPHDHHHHRDHRGDGITITLTIVLVEYVVDTRAMLELLQVKKGLCLLRRQNP